MILRILEESYMPPYFFGLVMWDDMDHPRQPAWRIEHLVPYRA